MGRGLHSPVPRGASTIADGAGQRAIVGRFGGPDAGFSVSLPCSLTRTDSGWARRPPASMHDLILLPEAAPWHGVNGWIGVQTPGSTAKRYTRNLARSLEYRLSTTAGPRPGWIYFLWVGPR